MNEIVIERKDSDHLIVKESDNSSSSVSEDITRYEEKWTERHEEFLKQMKLDCNTASVKHNISSRANLWYYRLLAVPSITLPLFSAFLNEYLQEDMKIITSAILLLRSGFAGVNTIFNFGKKAQQHNEYSGKYYDVQQEIAYTLTRKKKNRMACDISLEKYISKVKLLNGNAPQL